MFQKFADAVSAGLLWVIPKLFSKLFVFLGFAVVALYSWTTNLLDPLIQTILDALPVEIAERKELRTFGEIWNTIDYYFPLRELMQLRTALWSFEWALWVVNFVRSWIPGLGKWGS